MVSSGLFKTVFASAVLLQTVSAHIALWHPSMFGWESDINQVDPVTPLADSTFDQWWFHGYKSKPPAAGKIMELPAGGTFKGEVACNKAQTTWVYPDESVLSEWACNSGSGPMHTTDAYGSENPTNVMGCGLSIAYTSDENSVQPEDFAVISTDYNCPWKRRVDFPIPADLPACPEGGCLCSWGWIHSPMSGSEQMYHLVYRCNVTGATNTRALPSPKTANKCDYPTSTSNCTVGPRQPHYWLQKERNNNLQDYYDPPYYNGQYGFMNGAQTDLFAGTTSGSTTADIAPATTTAVSTTSASQATSSVSSSTVVASSTVTDAANLVISQTSATGSSIASSSVQVSASSSAQASVSPSVQVLASATAPTTVTQVSSSSAVTATSSSTTTTAKTKTCMRKRNQHTPRRVVRRTSRIDRTRSVLENNEKSNALLDRQRLVARGMELMAAGRTE